MNNIKWLELTFAQITPIHIGKYNYGVISESRIFIPGFTMWGALVNAYGLKNGATDEIYTDAKKKFEYTTCFYPVLNGDIYFPKFCAGQLFYASCSNEKRYSEQEIKVTFTDTCVSTAVSPANKAARDESLHEIEVFLNRSKYNTNICGINNINQVYWRGLIGLRDSSYRNFLCKGLEIIVGGDVKYGLGRLRLESIKEIGESELEAWNMNKNGYFRNNGNSVANYVDVRGAKLLKGKVETVVQLDYTKAIPEGIKDKDEEAFSLCFVPGSIVSEKNGSLLKLKKGVFRISN
ncbi:MAG TPA: hypothetical protein DCE02_01535 [Ruminiclostridium sp.]|uniref:RAMP superfamily protein n=1 Tax=Acetivibrio saccincola TaxID=1677857 RepID=A0A2S8RC18_9FIRM|nr:hypothetical protein [Acetivibrio saccincola]NLW27443.1 hypothetical protein [Acetivibrio saccincola]PQQ67344.1 hypothetical protein B9R14_11675 [Acetivibrio saccincola]HAA42675.1 hypothetical protein [Ruminiclostridium sp.]